MAFYKTLSCLFTIILATTVIADIGDNLKQLNVNDIQNQLPSELANTNLTMDDAKTLLKDKCIEIAGKEKGDEAFEEIMNSFGVLSECLTTIINYTAIQTEIEEASPRGELDVVFNKYCKKRPHVIECVEVFNKKLVPCLDAEEQDNQETVMRIVRSLLSFVCHKGGDQIALFIAEKGPECLESKRDDIQQCLNDTFSDYVPKEGFQNFKSLPKLVMSQKQCNDIEKLETCIVERLETCTEITPANIVESMFRFIKNETICRNTPSAHKQNSTSSSSLLVTLSATGLAFSFAVIQLISKRFYV
ncbi:27 kDa hemolymph protein-like [Teleopsis dalmanni]|uniref:27 kDa hemolymph protein n=1 Tax=Teleopsis dalmanni TaxID=139649 RepID=UPI0018CE582B|nr:27 kDa hemolymph protein [Teleopsis dalmanni]XP_037936727.1 27 kDa hemolymph protein-like [Teleopsis dalmanni]